MNSTAPSFTAGFTPAESGRTTAFLKSRPHFTRQDVAPFASTAAKPARSVWSAGRWKPVKSRLYSIAET